MSALLTPDDLQALTHKRQPAAQIRELRRMGLQPIVRADGTPAITWDAVNARMQGQAAKPRPQLNLRAFQKAG
ncbi:MAG: hypothetical protein BGP24_14925 [Lysobacterales bacterium 69-70]|nr:DUF4224 domain-containing protein [Xanthomonadaceae bacterium]ODU35377.1 MAG: hypothetical protein ABS97_05750 [Xanthomonadaceae bacterium SCN 69-320]ODV16858.1 MAG: hypothetical protein ABT27_18965 [Xanthomonadaceae bacterium SCN 69-25]OJY94272.1 MAG: hypothetical protein BGP24_14925 [Xanthomonadales bacterium 69-70]